jgi:hypothetical protein
MARTITIPPPVSNNAALAKQINGIVCLGAAALGEFPSLASAKVKKRTILCAGAQNNRPNPA